MKRSRKEATAEWISEQMQAVISAYPKKDIEATVPVIILLMAKELGLDNLEPKIRAAFDRIAERAGVTESMTPDEVARALERYTASLSPNVNMLEEIRAIFVEHDTALEKEKQESFAAMTGGSERKLPAMIDARPPPNTMSAKQLIQSGRRPGMMMRRP